MSSLLTVENVRVVFNSNSNKYTAKKNTANKSFTALNNVSFSLQQGEVLGIVGESGCGKSTLARTILQLQEVNHGNINWKGKDLGKYPLGDLRKKIQLIFQDPLDALNPRMTIFQIIAEPLHNLMPKLGKAKIRKMTLETLQSMGLQIEQQNRYPHEFSGGQCQRIGIARAMIVNPELLICDEPVSALDVSIQAQIINLLMAQKERTGMSMIFISHDLSIVRHICDRVLVLYKGEIVEIAEAEQLYTNPQHPYTQKLLHAIPLLDPKKERLRISG